MWIFMKKNHNNGQNKLKQKFILTIYKKENERV